MEQINYNSYEYNIYLLPAFTFAKVKNIPNFKTFLFSIWFLHHRIMYKIYIIPNNRGLWFPLKFIK